MKLLKELENRRIEEMFNKDRCKQCSVPLGDDPRTSMKRHSALSDYCEMCGDDTFPDPDKNEYLGDVEPT